MEISLTQIRYTKGYKSLKFFTQSFSEELPYSFSSQSSCGVHVFHAKKSVH